MPSYPGIAKALSLALGTNFPARPAARVHGGCINDCHRWESVQGPVFVKLATTDRASMFEAEAAGLAQAAPAD